MSLLLASSSPSDSLAQDGREAPIPSKTAKLPDRETPAVETTMTAMERGIARVKRVEIANEIDLAKLAYQKARNERVRQYASKLEAAHASKLGKFERLAKADAPPISRPERDPVAPDANLESRAAKGEPDPNASPRRGEGSQDPSFGNKPDAGSLDKYNRNTVNPSADSDEDRAQLRKALKEQSTPTVVDKKRDVEKQAGDSKLGNSGPLEDQWVTIQEAILAQRLKTARLELTEKGGADFDECYLRMQIAAQQCVIDSDRVYAAYFSLGNRPLIDEEADRASAFLGEARELLKELTGEVIAKRSADRE